MKKLTMVLAAATALVSAPALAADLGRAPPVRAPVMAPAPIYNWSGFYIGVQGGGAFGTTDWTYVTGLLAPTASSAVIGDTASHDTSGGLIGGTIGFNWQAGAWVFGVEADYAWADITGSVACPNVAFFDCQSKLDSFGTGRGRVGWSWGPGMIYATGGAAFGDQHIRTVEITGLNIPPSFTPRNGSSNFQVGWTAGGGVEFGFAPGWSAKVEALYYDLGTERFTVDNGLQVDANHTGVVVRGGINYRFGWGGPGY